MFCNEKFDGTIITLNGNIEVQKLPLIFKFYRNPVNAQFSSLCGFDIVPKSYVAWWSKKNFVEAQQRV